MAFGTQYQHVGLYAHPLQFLHAMLSGFCLQFPRRLEVWDVRQVYTYGPAPQFPPQLPYGFHEGGTLYVSYRAAHLGNDEVVLRMVVFTQHPSLYLVRDVRHHLYGLAKVVPMPLAVDYRLVYAPCSDGVVARGTYARESLVMPQVEVSLHTVDRNVALPVLVGVERARVDVDVRVKLLDGNVVPPCL